MSTVEEDDEKLTFTVGTVWREQRVSCPHPDILRAYLAAALEQGAMDFLQFHLEECECPYCNAVIKDFRARDEETSRERFVGLRDKLMRSTTAALRSSRLAD